MTISPPSPALWIIISWLAFKFLMASFSSTVMFWWWLIHFLLHKLIIPFFIDILINILINFITVVLWWVLWVIFMLFGHILSFLFFFFSANTGTMPKTSQITMNSKHTYTSTNTNLSKILKFWHLKGIYIKKMKENYGKTNSSAFGHKKYRIEFNIEMKHYRRELYEGFADLTA